MSNLQYELTVTPFANGDIKSELEFIHDDVRERVLTQVMHTQEQGVRAALIKLGWKPPEGK